MFWTKSKPAKYIPKHIIDALRHNFKGDEVDQLDQLATMIDVEAGTTLTTEGSRGTEAFVLVSGAASVAQDGDIVATVGPGDVIGEISLLSGERRNATVVTTAPTTVYAMAPRDFATLLARCPRLNSRVAITAIKRISHV